MSIFAIFKEKILAMVVLAKEKLRQTTFLGFLSNQILNFEHKTNVSTHFDFRIQTLFYMFGIPPVSKVNFTIFFHVFLA